MKDSLQVLVYLQALGSVAFAYSFSFILLEITVSPTSCESTPPAVCAMHSHDCEYMVRLPSLRCRGAQHQREAHCSIGECQLM